MLYGDEVRVVNSTIGDAALATAVNLTAALGAILTKTMEVPGTVKAFGFRPTIALNYNVMTAQGVLGLYIYPAGVSANKVLLGTINLMDGDVVGKIYFMKPLNQPADVSPAPAPPCNYNAGDQLVVEVKTAATGGGGIAGAYQPVIWANDRGENIVNQAQLVNRTP